MLEDARMSASRRARMRPGSAISSNPASTPRRSESISLVIAFAARSSDCCGFDLRVPTPWHTLAQCSPLI